MVRWPPGPSAGHTRRRNWRGRCFPGCCRSAGRESPAGPGRISGTPPAGRLRRRCPVYEQDEGVVQLALPAQVVHDPADVPVHALDHRRVDLHRPRRLSPFLVLQGLPLAGQGEHRMGFDVRFHQAQLLEPGQAFLAQRFWTGVGSDRGTSRPVSRGACGWPVRRRAAGRRNGRLWCAPRGIAAACRRRRRRIKPSGSVSVALVFRRALAYPRGYAECFSS